MIKKEKIVIIGGGFAGLNLAKSLDYKKFEVLLIDRNNYHSFPPLFYQIASSGIDPASISFPFRKEFRKEQRKGLMFMMGRVYEINPVSKIIHVDNRAVAYDRLVIAAGTTNNFFNMPQLEESVFTLKSTPESITCRNAIIRRLERAASTADPEQRRKLLSFTVIGGGPTGVEVAGAIGEMKRYVLGREYPAINVEELQITLLEGSDRLLRTMSEESSRHAEQYLGHLMVDVRKNTMMTSYEDNVITLADGSKIYSEMVIWTAGVTAVPFTFLNNMPQLGPGRRFPVDEFCRVEGLEDVYALGDISITTSDPAFPKGHPQLAQVAIQMAHALAENLNSGKFTKKFRYNDKGSMATVGRNRAVVDLKIGHFYGRPAWLTWMFVHLMSILGMRNRLVVLITWVWAYFTYGSSLRILLKTSPYPKRK